MMRKRRSCFLKVTFKLHDTFLENVMLEINSSGGMEGVRWGGVTVCTTEGAESYCNSCVFRADCSRRGVAVMSLSFQVDV